jgi:hypothetical protein
LAARNKVPRHYQKLTKKGILHVEMLGILWEDRTEHIEILQTLLVKLGFFVPILQDVSSRATSNDNCYLIPHLLPRSLTFQACEPRLVGYIFFALKDSMKDFRANGYVSLEDIARDGFFPMGLGPAVMGQIVSECQRVHDMTIEDMELSINEIAASFGKHKFLARFNNELPLMELVIMVDSALLTVERMLDLVGKAVAQMIPDLEFALAVAQDGGRCPEGQVPTPHGRGPLVLVSGRGGLQDKVL